MDRMVTNIDQFFVVQTLCSNHSLWNNSWWSNHSWWSDYHCSFRSRAERAVAERALSANRYNLCAKRESKDPSARSKTRAHAQNGTYVLLDLINFVTRNYYVSTML